MTLEQQTAARLRVAGIAPDDRALQQLRAWNAAAYGLLHRGQIARPLEQRARLVDQEVGVDGGGEQTPLPSVHAGQPSRTGRQSEGGTQN